MININHIIPNFLSYIIFLTIHFSYYSKFQIYLPPLHFHFNLYFTFVGTALCCAVLWVVTHILCVSDRERQRESFWWRNYFNFFFFHQCETERGEDWEGRDRNGESSDKSWELLDFQESQGRDLQHHWRPLCMFHLNSPHFLWLYLLILLYILFH